MQSNLFGEPALSASVKACHRGGSDASARHAMRVHEWSILSRFRCQPVTLDGKSWTGRRSVFGQRTGRTHGIRRMDPCLPSWSRHDGFVGADFVVGIIERRAGCAIVSAIAIHRSSAHVAIAVKGRRHKHGSRSRSHAG